MSDKKVLSFDEYLAEEDATFTMVETKRGDLKIASCSSAEIMAWFDENDAVLEDGTPDTETRRHKGLRLIVRCIVNPDGSRIPKDLRAAAVNQIRNHDQRENGRLMRAAYEVNGLIVAAKKDESKNVLSETTPGASPIASPSPQGK